MSNKRNKQGGLSAFISSDNGQRFFNFAYSIGAAVVILGALFKILHLTGGNTLLTIGMGTEVLMFILTAFDRPPKEYKWEEVFPQLHKADEEANAAKAQAEAEELVDDLTATQSKEETAATAGHPVAGGAVYAGGPIIIGGQGGDTNGGTTVPMTGGMQADSPSMVVTPAPDVVGSTEQYIEQLHGITAQLGKLQSTTEALNEVSEVLLGSYRVITENSESITASSQGYVEEMQNLSRNISGLNTIYEIQLKSISSQLDAIDRVNRGIKDIRDMYEKSADQSARYCEETERMARYMQQLNSVYERMITAMTVNMYRPMMGAEGMGASATAAGDEFAQQGVPVERRPE